MTNSSESDVRARLDAAVRELHAHAAFSVDPCDVAKLIAVGDERIVARMIERLLRGDRLRSVRCVGTGRVLCAFDCAPDRICLVAPSFLAVVDLARRLVTEIVDPYDPTTEASTSTGRTQLATPAALGAQARSLSAVFSATTGAVGSYDVTLTVTGVPYKSAQVQRVGDDTSSAELPFDGDVATGSLPAGSYEGFVTTKGWPHTPYTVAFEPQGGKKWSLPTKTNGKGDGFTAFRFDLPASD